jgi:hypothetical protein
LLRCNTKENQVSDFEVNGKEATKQEWIEWIVRRDVVTSYGVPSVAYQKSFPLHTARKRPGLVTAEEVADVLAGYLAEHFTPEQLANAPLQPR